MSTQRQYNPLAVDSEWMGIDLTQGVADSDNWIRILPDNNGDRWTEKPDGDGGETRVKSVRRSGFVEIDYAAGSPTNRKLGLLADADDARENVIGPFMFRDPSGGEQVLGVKAYLKGKPGPTRGNDESVVTWRWRLPVMVHTTGGHDVVKDGDVASILADAGLGG